MITKEDLINEGFVENEFKYEYKISDKKTLTLYLDDNKFCIEILPYTDVYINSIEEVKFLLNMCKNE
jgi:hypothetical protein